MINPQSAGLVERTNGTIKQRLRKCMEETGRAWPECLSLVKMWMRLTQGSQKLTPFEIIHGRAFPLPITSEPLDKSARETTLAEWMTKLLENKEIVLNNQLPSDSSPVSSRLKPGDWILTNGRPLPGPTHHAHSMQDCWTTFMDPSKPHKEGGAHLKAPTQDQWA